MIKSSRKNGSAIILSVLAIAAVTTIVIGIATLVPRDFQQSRNLESSLNAENAAWAGVEHALLLLRQAKEANTYFELSQETRPYSRYAQPASGVNCLDSLNRANSACSGLDRLLGNPVNQTPVWFTNVLGLPDTSYGLAVWHRRQNVGTPDVTDGGDKTRSTTNVNPMLERDEVRRLDVRNTTALTLYWMPIFDTSGAACRNGAGFRSHLLITLYDEQGNVRDRRASSWPGGSSPVPVTVSNLGGMHTMAIRFLVTASNETDVRNCFMRYSLQNTGTETADLGFDVIDSVGVSGGVRRKIRVLVNRDNGRLLNVFDFGVVCNTCTNLP